MQVQILLTLQILLLLHYLLLRKLLVRLLDLTCSLPLHQVASLAVDDVAVLQEVYLMAEGLDDCKDEVVELQRWVFEVFDGLEHFSIYALHLLEETIDDGCLLRPVDVLIEDLIEDK